MYFHRQTLISSTPPSKPRLGSCIGRFKIEVVSKRQLSCVALEKSERVVESSSLSLTTAGSSMNAALGGVSAGGIGTPESEVTHSGGGPEHSSQPSPEATRVEITASKFSLKITSGSAGRTRHRTRR